jgi:formamidopyrimidine-DNA glycosylase
VPELPDIQIIAEFLNTHVAGQHIESVDYVGALVVRNLLTGSVEHALRGRVISGAKRRGKFLILELEGEVSLVVNFMLSGRLWYAPPAQGTGKRTFLVLTLADRRQLRYVDQTQMGKIYLTNDLSLIPTFADQGPDALDPGLSLSVFEQRLRRHPGEIKGTLTNQAFIAGIGNAYADEILFEARLYPFLRRSELGSDGIERLHTAQQDVLRGAIETLRQRVGSNIQEEIRDFLRIHGRPGQPCPRCGTAISQVAANQRITNFCRTCQPGTLIRQT